MSSGHLIHIRKEANKFSSAHMTVFPDGTKEALHGHNYFTELTLELKDVLFKEMVSFSEFKRPLKELCDAWDEKVLLPERCTYLELRTRTQLETEFLLCGQRYVLPSRDVVWLPIENTSVEMLAQEAVHQYLTRLKKSLPTFLPEQLLALHLSIFESRGQGATHVYRPTLSVG